MNKQFSQLLVIILFSFSINLSFAQKKETRNVGSFDEIKIGGAYDVFIKKGSSQEVILEGPEKLLEKTVTEVKDGVLKVHKEKNWGNSWSSGRQIKVYITYTDLKGLYSSGSSDIVVESEVKADEFAVKCSGSGDMEVPLNVTSLTASISGSGDIKLKGTTNDQSMNISGSGDIDASDLQAQKATLKITGSGSMKVHVTEYMEGRITGSGKIRYKGDPKQSVRITGSGSVRRE